MRSNTRSEHCSTKEDREQFIKDNAIVIVEELEARVERQRKWLYKLNKRNESRKNKIQSQRKIINRYRKYTYVLLSIVMIVLFVHFVSMSFFLRGL